MNVLLTTMNANLESMRQQMEAAKVAADLQNSVLKAQMTGQTARLEALEEENASLREASESEGKGKKEDTRVFLPTSSDSPYFPCPRNHTSFKPFVAPLTGDHTADRLEGEALEEYKTTHWVAKSLHDCVFHFKEHSAEWVSAIGEGTLPAQPDRSATYLEAMQNTLEETHSLLLHRLQLVRTRVHLKEAHGGLTVSDTAMLDYVHAGLYGAHPGQVVLDPKMQEFMEKFGQKMVSSKLHVGAKAAVTGNENPKPTASSKQQRKNRLAREAAAKKKQDSLAAAPSR